MKKTNFFIDDLLKHDGTPFMFNSDLLEESGFTWDKYEEYVNSLITNVNVDINEKSLDDVTTNTRKPFKLKRK